MDEQTNGHPPERNTFGQLPNQSIPKEWADTFLQIVYDEYPAVFRAVLPRCAGLPAEQPKQRKARMP